MWYTVPWWGGAGTGGVCSDAKFGVWRALSVALALLAWLWIFCFVHSTQIRNTLLPVLFTRDPEHISRTPKIPIVMKKTRR